MKFCSIVALALLVALAAGSTARADCAYKPFDFHPEKNDGVVVESIVDASSSCTHNFAEGPGYKFTGITFVREPENGKLVNAGTSASDQSHPFPGVANFGKPDKILEVRKAECALKSFHVRYKESDHNFFYQRIAIRDVLITGSAVRFNVETALKDDSNDANAYLGEVEGLASADVYPDP